MIGGFICQLMRLDSSLACAAQRMNSRLPELAVRLSRRWQMGCLRGRGLIKVINQGDVYQYHTDVIVLETH